MFAHRSSPVMTSCFHPTFLSAWLFLPGFCYFLPDTVFHYIDGLKCIQSPHFSIHEMGCVLDLVVYHGYSGGISAFWHIKDKRMTVLTVTLSLPPGLECTCRNHHLLRSRMLALWCS